MAELKTQKNDASVAAFIGTVPDEKKQADARALADIMRAVTRAEPKMWGGSIIGFGNSIYRYPDGREMDWFKAGFSPRKQALTLYLRGGVNQDAELMAALGKHTTGKGCIYIKRLDDVHLPTLKKLIRASLKNKS